MMGNKKGFSIEARAASGGDEGSARETDIEKRIKDLEDGFRRLVDTNQCLTEALFAMYGEQQGLPAAIAGSTESNERKIKYTDNRKEFVLQLENGAGMPVEGKILAIKEFLASKEIGIITADKCTEDDSCFPAGSKVNRHDATITIQKDKLTPEQLEKITSSERIIHASKSAARA